MTLVSSYERIVTALGDALRDATEVGDREIETKIHDLQTIAIDRLYAALDHLPARQVSPATATCCEELG